MDYGRSEADAGAPKVTQTSRLQEQTDQRFRRLGLGMVHCKWSPSVQQQLSPLRSTTESIV